MKLESTMSTTNMNLFNQNCQIVKYDSVLEIMHEFRAPRLEMYVRWPNH